MIEQSIDQLRLVEEDQDGSMDGSGDEGENLEQMTEEMQIDDNMEEVGIVEANDLDEAGGDQGVQPMHVDNDRHQTRMQGGEKITEQDNDGDAATVENDEPNDKVEEVDKSKVEKGEQVPVADDEEISWTGIDNEDGEDEIDGEEKEVEHDLGHSSSNKSDSK